ncbi:hypothetical protein BJ508DRAFT_377801 [Ascobolus immersus RN42]|uniref:AAA domain-containing protein n=1 Tax=Ascobolus immersus RN42 TaxID=1160509 RepID=A0A3N4HZL0_ASCIM|nr:hypothetical protein BJ508DRAFT_377801 [Ascobolus immersus RN42]
MSVGTWQSTTSQVNQQPIIRKSYEDEVHLEVSNSPKATIPRKDTVAKLHNLMKKYQVVHVRAATPGPGKILTLLRFLRAYCKSDQSDFDVLMVGSALALARRLGLSIDDLRTSRPGSKKIAILLDEAQNSYRDVHLWHTFIKTYLKFLPHVRFVVASCYGSMSYAEYHEKRGAPTPEFFEKDQFFVYEEGVCGIGV